MIYYQLLKSYILLNINYIKLNYLSHDEKVIGNYKFSTSP